MLRSAKHLEGYRIQARDGIIGRLGQFYFDDRTWGITDVVVEVGTWLHERAVLLAPMSIIEVNDANKTIHVALTMEQIKRSPDVRSHRPVALRQPHDYHLYLGWPNYLSLEVLEELSRDRSEAPRMSELEKTRLASQPIQRDADAHLRSSNVVGRYRIIAVNGEIGHIEDFLIDDQTWTIRYAVADTRNWWHGKTVLLSTNWILWVSWAESTAYVGLTRESIASAPEFNPGQPLTRDYEMKLYAHHQRKPYWKAHTPA